MDTCPDCGFTYGLAARADIASSLGEFGRQIAGGLIGSPVQLTTRRRPDQWSALEYACHVRDVLLMQRDRIYVALVEEEPSFKPMYREQRVAFDRYNEQAPEVVSAQLLMAAAMLAHSFDGLADDQWDRPLIYGFPESSRQTVEWVGHHTLHELVHHQADIAGILADR
jgi:hypothetical protein